MDKTVQPSLEVGVSFFTQSGVPSDSTDHLNFFFRYVHNPHCLPLSHLELDDSSSVRIMTEPVSPRPRPADHLVRSRASPRGVCC